jgi:hypothetical protein
MVRRGGFSWSPTGHLITTAPAAYKLHVRGVHFEREALLTVSVRPFFEPKSSLHIHWTPFGQILRGGFGLSPPECDAKPAGHVLHLARAVFTFFVSRDRKTTDGRALWRISQFRVFPQIADEYDFIERHFGSTSSLSSDEY